MSSLHSSARSAQSSAHNGSNNIVSHIRDLLPLPKHVIFHVKLVIHQLQSVPLISGEFRIKWKFRNLQVVNSAGRPLGLGRALVLKLEGHKKSHHGVPNSKGKEKELAPVEIDSRGDEHQQEDSTFSTPQLDSDPAESTYFDHPSKQSTLDSTSGSNSQFDTLAPVDDPIDYRSEERGHTSFLPLCDYKVDFESEINVAIQMSIERETLALLPSELKLTVMQRVIPNDPESPLNPRLGHVQVNLAEYADAGSVTRNYLLRRSKVNAMLNMTITMTRISGEENYRAPPLRKEEIKAGISDFLSIADMPLPALSRYTTPDDPWLSGSLQEFLNNDETPDEPEEPVDPTLEVPRPESRSKKRWRVKSHDKRGTSATREKVPEHLSPPKTNGTMPRKQRLHPTEALIEAIFNPYPTTSVAPSPFTYYTPPVPPLPRQKQDSTGSEGHGTDGTSRGSFDSSRRTSEYGHDGASIGGNGNGSRWWRWRTGSRPTTPARTNSSRS